MLTVIRARGRMELNPLVAADDLHDPAWVGARLWLRLQAACPVFPFRVSELVARDHHEAIGEGGDGPRGNYP